MLDAGATCFSEVPPSRHHMKAKRSLNLLSTLQSKAQFGFSSGTLMSGLSLLVLMPLLNMLFGSVLLFKVANLRSAVCHCASRLSA